MRGHFMYNASSGQCEKFPFVKDEWEKRLWGCEKNKNVFDWPWQCEQACINNK